MELIVAFNGNPLSFYKCRYELSVNGVKINFCDYFIP